MCHEQWALTVIKHLRFFVLITGSKWRSLLMAWDHDNVTPKTTEQCLIVCNDKFAAYINNNRRLRSTFVLLKLKLTTDRHEASRGLLVFSLLWSSILVVINKIHCCMAFCAVNCTVHCRSCCSHFTSDRSDSQIVVENRDFCLPHVRSTPSLGVSVGIFVWSGKTKIVWLPEGEKKFVKKCYRLFVSTESTNAMNGRTDGQTLHDGIGHAYA